MPRQFALVRQRCSPGLIVSQKLEIGFALLAMESEGRVGQLGFVPV